MDLDERIARYLTTIPGAVSGQEGHTQTLKVAMVLYNGFGLSEEETLYWLEQYNPRCNPPWEEKDLKRKASEAAKFTYNLARGHLLKNGEIVRDEVVRKVPPKTPEKQRIDPTNCIENFLRGFRCNEHEIFEASPIKPSDDFTEDGILVVEHLFQPGEMVNFVTKFKMSAHRDGQEKAVPHGYGESVEQSDLICKWSMSGMPASEAGGWMRMNPTDGEGISDANITKFRHILLEFDNIPLELQLSLFSKLPLPIAAILTSGGKSVHAWVRADCLDVTNYKDTSAMLLKMLERFGLDGKNKNPSRLSRLPGVTRKLGASEDGRQRLLFLNPNPEQKAIL